MRACARVRAFDPPLSLPFPSDRVVVLAWTRSSDRRDPTTWFRAVAVGRVDVATHWLWRCFARGVEQVATRGDDRGAPFRSPSIRTDDGSAGLVDASEERRTRRGSV